MATKTLRRTGTSRAARALACSALLLAACGGTPETGIARCPTPPDAAVLAALPGDVAGGDAESGAALFARECTRCHAPDVAARDSRFFADYPRLDCDDYLAGVSDRYLATAIADGGVAIGRDELMKPFAPLLSEQEIADLVAYLRVRP